MRNTLISKIIAYIGQMLKTTTPESAMAFFSFTTIECGNISFIATIGTVLGLLIAGKSIDSVLVGVILAGITTFISVGYAGKHYSGKYETSINGKTNENEKVKRTV